MLEWLQSESDDGDLPPVDLVDPSRAQAYGRRGRLATGVLGGSALLLSLGGWLRLDRARDAMREEIVAQIEVEERARAFGLVEHVDSLVSSAAEPAWLDTYRLRFSEGARGDPRTVEVRQIEWRDQAAVVLLAIDDYPQVRAYILERDGWRRAPMPASEWGTPEGRLDAGGIELRYASRDTAFAQSIAPLVSQLAALSRSTGASPPYSRVVIRGLENSARASRVEADTLLLVSPLLLAPTDLSPSERIREAIVRRHTASLDPGGGRAWFWAGRDALAAAISDVLVARLALGETALEQQRAAWRAALDGRWRSPFGPLWEEAWGESRLVADQLFELAGAQSLTALLATGPNLAAWQHTIASYGGLTTYALEARTLNRLTGSQFAMELPTPPLQGEVRRADQRTIVFLEVHGIAGEVEIDPASVPLVLGDGREVESACAPLYGTLTVDGQWQGGRRLAAVRLTTANVQPEAPRPETVPAAGAVAELLVEERHFLTLYRNGSAQRWFALNEGQVLPARGETTPPSSLLALDSPPGCRTAFFYEVDPARRRVARSWTVDLEPLGALSPRWMLARFDRGAWLLSISRPERYIGYLRLDGTTLAPVHSSAVAPDRPLDWREGSQEVIAHRWLQQSMDLVLIGATRPRSLAHPAPIIQNLRQVDGGRGLVYIVSAPPWGPERSAVGYLDLETGRARELFVPSGSMRIRSGPLRLVPRDDGSETLLLVLVSQNPIDAATLIRLEIASGTAQTIAQIAPDEVILSAVTCPDDGLLFGIGASSASGDGSTRLVRWSPSGATRIVYESEVAVRPLGCLE